MRRIAVLLVAGAFGVGLVAPAAGHAATLNPGDIVVADPSAAGGKGALLLINPVTGAQSTVSSGADLSAGASWHAPDGLAMDPTGRILVSDDPIYSGDQAKIIRVNPATGFRTIVAAGGSLSLPVGLGVEPSGKILVADSGVVGAILRIDPVTGAQSTLSSGGSLVSPFGIAFDSAGRVLVVDYNAFGGYAGGNGGVLRINPATGFQVVVSAGTNFRGPSGIALDASGRIFVTDQYGADATPPDSKGNLFGVDPVSGVQTLISSGVSLSQGASWVDPYGIARDASGSFVVADSGDSPSFQPTQNPGRVVRVNPATGFRTLVSAGGELVDPVAVLVVPPTCAGRYATVVGDPSANRIVGTRFNDVIVGLAGKDKITGGKGNDLICGGTGRDVLRGGSGNDKLLGQGGADRLVDGRGKNKLRQ
jgi:Ca2+-binding RTX toxin-like protein